MSQPTTNPERAPSPCAVSDSHPEIGLRARITVRKDGVVTKVVEVRGHRIDGDESADCDSTQPKANHE